MLKPINSISLSLLLLCFMLHANAQHSDSDMKNNFEASNLFKYGEPLTSSETNMKNLFVNFPKFVGNSNIVDLLSYEKVGTVKNAKQAMDYLKKNFLPDLPAWMISYVSYQLTELSNRTMAEDKMDKKEAVKTIAEEYVKTGDEVYRIKFVYNLRTLYYYIFINPQTKEVVTKGNIFAFEIYPETLNRPKE